LHDFRQQLFPTILPRACGPPRWRTRISYEIKAHRRVDFTAAGLAPAALDALLEQQFRAQTAGYAAQFPALTLIVLQEKATIGRLMLAGGDRSVRILDIALLPSACGRGIGSDILSAVARAARVQGGEELVLSVLFSNLAARRLYERLGFAEIGDGVRIEMRKVLAA